MTGRVRVEILERLREREVDAVTWLAEAATEADGVRPLSEHVELHLRHGGDRSGRHVLAWDENRLAAYAGLDPTDLVAGPSAELVVVPALRRQGIGTGLLRTLLERCAAAPLPLRVWAHGGLPAAAGLAGSLGFRRTRELLQMARPLPYPEPAALPAGITVRRFAPGLDDAAWVALNAEVFASHPEQGRLLLDDLHIRMKEPWFDPAGFLLAERDGTPVGFAWTKVHGGSEQPRLALVGAARHAHAHAPIGELYVLGVASRARVGGLGRALTGLALHSLHERGLDSVMLYVDADNRNAVSLYSSMGFTRTAIDVMWQAPAAQPKRPLT